MAWLRQIGRRLKSDYRYSIGLLSNTFPTLAMVSDVSKLEWLTQDVLDALRIGPRAQRRGHPTDQPVRRDLPGHGADDARVRAGVDQPRRRRRQRRLTRRRRGHSRADCGRGGRGAARSVSRPRPDCQRALPAGRRGHHDNARRAPTSGRCKNRERKIAHSTREANLLHVDRERISDA